MSHFIVAVAVPDIKVEGDYFFQNVVENNLAEIMEPYNEQTYDPRYLIQETDDDGEEYYSNPDAKWDWYQIGGRWAEAIAVLEDAKEYVGNDYSWGAGKRKNAAGYCYVSGARMKDICWDKMRLDALNEAREEYKEYKDILSGVIMPKIFTAVKEDGVYGWGNELLLKTGESFEEYAERRNVNSPECFPLEMFAFIDRYGDWHERGSMGWFGISSDNKEAKNWEDECKAFFKTLNPEDVIVMVDCHI